MCEERGSSIEKNKGKKKLITETENLLDKLNDLVRWAIEAPKNNAQKNEAPGGATSSLGIQ